MNKSITVTSDSSSISKTLSSELKKSDVKVISDLWVVGNRLFTDTLSDTYRLCPRARYPSKLRIVDPSTIIELIVPSSWVGPIPNFTYASLKSLTLEKTNTTVVGVRSTIELPNLETLTIVGSLRSDSGVNFKRVKNLVLVSFSYTEDAARTINSMQPQHITAVGDVKVQATTEVSPHILSIIKKEYDEDTSRKVASLLARYGKPLANKIRVKSLKFENRRPMRILNALSKVYDLSCIEELDLLKTVSTVNDDLINSMTKLTVLKCHSCIGIPGWVTTYHTISSDYAINIGRIEHFGCTIKHALLLNLNIMDVGLESLTIYVNDLEEETRDLVKIAGDVTISDIVYLRANTSHTQ